MPNPSSGVSPDLGARPDALARFRAVMGCGIHGKLIGAGGPHFEAVHLAGDCDDCLSLLVAAIRAETLEEAAKMLDDRARTPHRLVLPSFTECAVLVRALTGSQTPNV